MTFKIKKFFLLNRKAKKEEPKLEKESKIVSEGLPEYKKEEKAHRSLRESLIVIIVISFFISVLAGTIAGIYSSTYIINRLGSSIFQNNIHFLHGANVSQENLSNKQISSNAEEGSVIAAVKKVNPSVVSIIASKYVTKYYGSTGRIPSDLFDDPFFKEFFEGSGIPEYEKQNQPQQKQEKQEVAGGTGFIISNDGLILTNKHVVSDQDADYAVVTNKGKKYKAKVLARDPFNDIAIVKINEKNLPAVELADSSKIQLGQTVIAIGNALGQYRNTVTKGVISGIGRRIIAGGAMGQSEVLENVIQTDTAINFGNSGGPLIDIYGKVVGINTAINSQGQLIGFAIPINQAKKDIGSVKKTGKIVKPFLGVRYILINEAIAKKNNLKINYGALILRGDKAGDLAVIPGSPADKAGLVENDIILEVNNTKITEEHSLSKEIQKYNPGDVLKLKILHKGKEKNIQVKIEEYKK